MAIEVQVLSDSRRAQADLAKLNASVSSIQKATESLTSSFKTAAISLGTIAVSSISLAGIIKLTDTFSELRTKLQLVATSNDEFVTSMRDVKRIAIETRQE